MVTAKYGQTREPAPADCGPKPHFELTATTSAELFSSVSTEKVNFVKLFSCGRRTRRWRYKRRKFPNQLINIITVRVRVTRRQCQILLSSIQNPLNSPFNIFQDM